MTEKVFEFVEGILCLFTFGALPILWVVEMVLSARWDKRYFSAGIPIFVFRVPVKAHHTDIPSCLLLENNFKSSGCIRNTSLLFEELDANTMGFRESLLQFGRWYSVMHGLLIFDAKKSQVIVKGFFDWTFLYFFLIWLIVPPLVWLLGFISLGEPILDEPTWLIALVYLGIPFVNIAYFCSMDYFRFSKVAKFAAQAWSRQDVAIVGGV